MPALLDMDPSDMAPSSLISCALRQLESANKIRSESCDSVESSLLKLVQGEEEDDSHVARAVQLCVAAEYARQFLLEVADIEVADSLLPGVDASLQGPEAWNILSECGTMLESLGAGDDTYLSLFAGGREKYRQRLQASVILGPTTITMCEEWLSALLQKQHEVAREMAAARTLEKAKAKAALDAAEIGGTEGNIGSIGGRRGSRKEKERSPRLVYDYGLMLGGVVFDFPRVMVRK